MIESSFFAFELLLNADLLGGIVDKVPRVYWSSHMILLGFGKMTGRLEGRLLARLGTDYVSDKRRISADDLPCR